MLKERTVHLRIKIKSLVAESRIIRAEANRLKPFIAKESDTNKKRPLQNRRERLHNHRRDVVRVHTRLNLLAYGILRGIPYEVMEKKCFEKPYFPKISKIAKDFGAAEDQITKWVSDAKIYLHNKKEIELAA